MGGIQYILRYLGEVRGLSRLVLGNLVDSVLTAFLALAEGFSFLGNIDHPLPN